VWTADDLFGLHPTVPLSRVDAMGLVWLLKGKRVTLLTETEARLERGLAYYRTTTIERVEAGGRLGEPSPATLSTLQHTFECAGLEFLRPPRCLVPAFGGAGRA
jgi:hypothetical protein